MKEMKPADWRSFNDHLKEVAQPAPEPAPMLIPAGKLFDRDLSWLQFNERVLSEAADDTVPPLERLRFTAIVSSNLDEFFMVRVAEIARNAKRQRTHTYNVTTSQRLLAQIRDLVLRQKSRQAAVLREIFEVLAKAGILIYSEFGDQELDAEIKSKLPELKFIIRRSSEPLPPLLSERLHIFVRFPDSYAIITIDDRSGRLLQLESTGRTLRYVLLERWLSARARELFPNQEVIEAFPFKIIRDADLRYRPDDEDSLEEQILVAVQGRQKARVVRLEVDAPNYSEGALFLATAFRLDSASLYRFDLPLDLRTLATLYNVPGFNQLRYNPIKPQMPPMFTGGADIFKAIRHKDILLHHPYDTFDVIEKFIEKAAKDPHVTHIYHTMYRTSKESPLMKALQDAVKQGKKVTAYVEIKARFDELNNVRWADELRKSKVRVVRPMGGFKVHCKMTQVWRNENGREISYLHLGTGNYHPGTAKQYTDLGLLTTDPQMGEEALSYFNSMASRKPHRPFNQLLAAPTNLQKSFERMIREETKIQRNGGRGHIIAKMNALVDPSVIRALYDASKAGVKIELIVRGICCLRPGIKGLSENIRVVSVVDRFLEHSRIYYFRANGARKLYLSSADWMPRNFYGRYEVAFPIKDPVLRKYIREVVLGNSLADNTKAWVLKSDGSYDRVTPSPNAKWVRSQFLFEELAGNRYQNTLLAQRP